MVFWNVRLCLFTFSLKSIFILIHYKSPVDPVAAHCLVAQGWTNIKNSMNAVIHDFNQMKVLVKGVQESSKASFFEEM